MKRTLLILLVLVLVIVAIGLVYYFFRNRQERNELILYGNVDVRQVDIGFRVAGIVEELYFQEGDFVESGHLMARLNRTPFISQMSQAEANALSVKANLENAEKLVKRREELIGVGGVSQEDLDDAISNRNVLKANLAAAEAAAVVTKNNLFYTEAFAPTDGIVLTRIREPGTVVNPSDPVCTVSITSPIWVRAFVSEPDLGRVFFGMQAEVFTDTPNAPIYTGKVGFISPVSEFTPKTVQTTRLRTDLVYRLRIYIDKPDAFLKQGMPVTIKLKLKNG